MAKALSLAILLVALCLPIMAAEAVPDEDLLGELEKVEVTQQKSREMEQQGSQEKLHVMEQMAQNQKRMMTQMAQDQKRMMTQMSQLGSTVKEESQQRHDAGQADLQRCRRELDDARTRLHGRGDAGVADLHSLLAPRGPGGEGKQDERPRAATTGEASTTPKGEGHYQARRARETIAGRSSLTAEDPPEPTATDEDEEDSDGHELGESIMGKDYEPYFHTLLDDQPEQRVKFALAAAGLPLEDPIPRLQARLGESLHEHHTDEIARRLRSLGQQMRKLNKLEVPTRQYNTEEEVKQAFSHFDAPMRAFYDGAKGLHLTDLQPIKGFEPDDELGEGARFWRRRKKRTAAARRGKKRTAAAQDSTTKALNEGEPCKSDIPEKKCGSDTKSGLNNWCKFCGSDYAHPSSGKCCKKDGKKAGPCNGKEGGMGQHICVAVTRRRRCKIWDGMSKKALCTGMMMMNKIGTGIKALFGLVKMVAAKFLALIAKLVKGLLCTLTGKFCKKASSEEELGENIKVTDGKPLIVKMGQKFLKPWVRCMDPLLEEIRGKCSKASAGGGKNEDGVLKCKNGGGLGQNWMWLERINTRKPSNTWFEIVPDATECHDQMPEKRSGPRRGTYGDGHECAKGREDMCEYDLGGPPKSLKNLNTTRNFTSFRPKKCPKSVANPPEDPWPWLPNNSKLRGSPFCAERFGFDRGRGALFSGINSTAAKEFWNGWDYEKYRHMCEYDNRCVLYNIGAYQNIQGIYRCVPRIHAEDPRYWVENDGGVGKMGKMEVSERYQGRRKGKYSLFHLKKGGIIGRKLDPNGKGTMLHDDGRIFLDPRDANINAPFQYQTALAKWQRPVQPLAGGSNGVRKAAIFPISDYMANMAYVQTGDMCLNYGWNETYGEETQGYMPRTRVRCLSGMYRTFSDPTMLSPCMGFSPSGMAKYILGFFGPILRLLPGGFYSLVQPIMVGIIGYMAGRALDNYMKRGLFIPFLGPYLGLLYEYGLSLLKDWTNVDLRNVLREHNKPDLVRAYMGAQDMAIDAAQDRMARVYYNKTDCGPEVTKHGTGCPDAIPIRSGVLAATRAGDITTSAMDTLFPKRQRTKIHTEYASLAYIKMSLCLKVPICDTDYWRTHGSMYITHREASMRGQREKSPERQHHDASGGGSMDCSDGHGTGRGTCVWNKAKGNHCKCDVGYKFLEECMRCCSMKWANDTTTWQEACGLNVTTKKCSEQVRFVAKKASRRPPRRNSNTAVPSSRSKEKIAKAMDKVHKKDAAMALTEAARHEEEKAMQRGKYEQAKPKIDALKAAARATKAATHPIMDTRGHGAESLLQEGETSGRAEDILHTGSGLDVILASMSIDGKEGNHAWKSYGEEFVSDRCDKLEYSSCNETIACMWNTEKGRCEDAAERRCTVKKKVIDCITYKAYAPTNLFYSMDNVCGVEILKQKPKPRKVCRFGVRKQESCESAFDCPLSTAELALRWPPEPDPHKGKIKTFEEMYTTSSFYDMCCLDANTVAPEMDVTDQPGITNYKPESSQCQPCKNVMSPETFKSLLVKKHKEMWNATQQGFDEKPGERWMEQKNAVIPDGPNEGKVAFGRCWTRVVAKGCAEGTMQPCKNKAFDIQGVMGV